MGGHSSVNWLRPLYPQPVELNNFSARLLAHRATSLMAFAEQRWICCAFAPVLCHFG
jgi:hypothetical protein